MDQDPNVQSKTRRRVTAWILFAIVLFFPILWMLRPSADTAFSTALQVQDGVLRVDSIHPVAPNRLERFGTDPLGRNITTFVAQGLSQAALIAAGAALLRTILGSLFGKVLPLKKVPFWLVAVLEVLLYRFLFSLPVFRTGAPSDHFLVLTLLLGAYFLPALHSDFKPRRMGLTVIDQFIRVILLLTVMGLLGLTVGANPYGAIPAAYPVTFTYPFLTNLLASVWDTRLAAWWVWGIPLVSVVALIIGVLLFKMPMQENYERRGVYFTNLAEDFFRFINPVRIVKDMIHFSHNLAINLLRLLVIGLAVLIVVWGTSDARRETYTPVHADFTEIQRELQDIKTPAERIAYADQLMQNSRLNSIGDTFLLESDGTRAVAGIRHGVSRTQPLLLVFDVRSDDLTFELQTALYHAVLKNLENLWVRQSILFVFTDGPIDNYRSLLNLSDRSFFAVLENLSGEPAAIDETLVYPGNSWAGSIAADFRQGFDQQGISHELSWLQPASPLALRMLEDGLMGVQIRGGHEQDPQKTLDALTDAVMRYATRDHRAR